MGGWSQCVRMLEIQFGEGVLYVGIKYNGLTSIVDHLTTCTMMWGNIPKKEWVHMLDTILKNWYTSLEL